MKGFTTDLKQGPSFFFSGSIAFFYSDGYILMDIHILTAADINAALPMVDAIALMKAAFSQFSAGDAEVPLRSRILVEKQQGATLFMPAFLKKTEDLAVKIVSVFPQNSRVNLDTIHAAVIVLDPQTGQPQALLEGSSLTAIRTGAATGAATDLLARKDAATVAIFGSGAQARTQLEAVCTVRPIKHVFVFSLDEPGAQAFCEEMSQVPHIPDKLEIAPSPIDAIRNADIICAATTSSTPIFPGDLVNPGTHVNAIGSFTPEMQEIDSALLLKARIIVDSREAVLAESGDLIIPIQQGLLDENDIYAELGEIVAGSCPGRTSEDQITVFKSVGIAIQDAMASSRALERALHSKIGMQVKL